MTRKEAKALELYFDMGYVVLIKDTPYVDSEVHAIYEDEDTGEYVYDSEVFSGRSLDDVELCSVVVAMPMSHLVTSTPHIPRPEISDYFLRGSK